MDMSGMCTGECNEPTKFVMYVLEDFFFFFILGPTSLCVRENNAVLDTLGKTKKGAHSDCNVKAK